MKTKVKKENTKCSELQFVSMIQHKLTISLKIKIIFHYLCIKHLIIILLLLYNIKHYVNGIIYLSVVLFVCLLFIMFTKILILMKFSQDDGNDTKNYVFVVID